MSDLLPFVWHRKPFGDRRGREALLDLACHAALAVALNSELLHLIRINFFYSHSGLDHFAEADLLLSPLCREIGSDLYELQSRGKLLERLYRRYSKKRIRKLAVLLTNYAKSCPDWLKLEIFKKSLLLTALLHLDPATANQLMEKQRGRARRDREEHKWLLAMQKEAELGKNAAAVKPSRFFEVHHLPAARPWQSREELRQLRVWRKKKQGICMLIGPKGAGKSVLVKRFLQEQAESQKGENLSVFIFSFHFAPDIESLFESLGVWLESKSEREIPERLGQRDGLLILDGLDKFQENNGRIYDWRLDRLLQRIAVLASAIVTSRRSLPKQGTRSFHKIIIQPYKKHEIIRDRIIEDRLSIDKGVQAFKPIVSTAAKVAFARFLNKGLDKVEKHFEPTAVEQAISQAYEEWITAILGSLRMRGYEEQELEEFFRAYQVDLESFLKDQEAAEELLKPFSSYTAKVSIDHNRLLQRWEALELHPLPEDVDTAAVSRAYLHRINKAGIINPDFRDLFLAQLARKSAKHLEAIL